jgi:branched-chain amino acid transport system ATP-binding protein
MTQAEPVLELGGITGGYGPVTVFRDVSLTVGAGEVVALLGPNGAGKTTLLRATAGLLPTTTGSVRLRGVDVTHVAPSERAEKGMCLIPEGRGIFRNLTVKENLRMSAPPWIKSPKFDVIYEAFPILKERHKQVAGTLSGGQQQILALSRAVLSEPSIVLVDEVSMGLAPVIVDVIFQALRRLVETGASLLLVEQYVDRALAISDRVYLLNKGKIVYVGAATDLAGGSVISEYLGNVSESVAT